VDILKSGGTYNDSFEPGTENSACHARQRYFSPISCRYTRGTDSRGVGIPTMECASTQTSSYIVLYNALVEYAYALLVLLLVKSDKNRNRVLDIRYIWGEANVCRKEYLAMSKHTRAHYYLDKKNSF
jgi:hypothetical protein